MTVPTSAATAIAAPWTETDLQRAAVGYARLGVRVFPLAPGTKQPRLERPHPDDTIRLPLADWQDPTKGGFHQGVCDPALVRAWWSSSFYAGSGIGYAIPPGVILVDVDRPDVLEARPELKAALEAADTFVVRSGRAGGLHFYFDVRGVNVEIRNTVAHPFEGVDTRVGGLGLGVLPRSPHASGRTYEHVRGNPRELAELPECWLQAYAAAGEQQEPPARTGQRVISATGARWRRGEPDAESATGTEAGTRNDSLLRALGRFRRACRTVDELAAIAAGINATYQPPMDAAEVAAVVASSWGYRDTDPAPEPEPEPAPEPEPGPSRETKPKRKPCSYEIGGFRRALRQVGVRIVRVMPSGHVGIIWRKGDDPEELEIDTDPDSRLQVLLRGKVRDTDGKRYYIPERSWRRTLYRETARKNPATYAHLVDTARSDIEGVILALPAGTYRVRDILIRADVLNRYESPARARQLEKLACKVLRERRLIPTGPVHRYSRWVSQRGGEGVWEADVPSQTCARCWRTPAGWQPATVPATVLPFENRSNRSSRVAESGQ